MHTPRPDPNLPAKVEPSRSIDSSSVAPFSSLRTFGSILFVDASGFSRIAEAAVADAEHGPERMARLLQRRFEPVIARCREHGGTIICFPGDAALVLFPAPAGDPNPMRAAVDAASALLRDSEVLANPMLRCGVACGEVEILSIEGPNDVRRDLVRGEAVRSAFEVHARAKPGELRWELHSRSPDGADPAIDRRPLERQDVPAFAQDPALSALASSPAEDVSEIRRVTTTFVRVGDWRTAGRASQARVASAIHAIDVAFAAEGGAIVQALFDEGGLTVMACFGLPGCTYEDDVCRAIRASAATEHALAELDFVPSIGIATGRTFVGIRGVAEKREFAPIGHAVNLAARLMQLGEARILLDESSASADVPGFRFLPLGQRSLPKLERARKVFGVVESVVAHAMVARRMFGREHERSLIDEAVTALGSRPSATRLGFEAPSGMGKSMLARYAEARLTAAAVRVVSIAGRERTADVPEISLASIFRDSRGESIEARIAERLKADEPRLRDWIPALVSVLDPRAAESPITQQMDPVQRHHAARRVFAQLLARSCEGGPCALLVDDAHGLDEATEDLVLHALRTVRPLGAFFFGRPDDSPQGSWRLRAATAGVAVHRLGGIDSGAIAAILREILGDARVSPRLVADVVARCDGHPLFVRHLALSMRDSIRPPSLREDELGQLEVREEGALPPTIEATISARFDRLPAEARHVLKLASVLGREFDEDTVEAMDVGAKETVEPALSNLASRGIIIRDPVTKRARFEHAMTREVAYNHLLGSQRRAYHGRAAAILADDESAVAVRAHHRFESDAPWLAIPDLDTAASESIRRFANHEALAYLERADRLELTYADRIGGSVHDVSMRRAHRAALIAEAAHKTGHHEEAMEYGRRAGECAGVSLPSGGIPEGLAAARSIAAHAIARRTGRTDFIPRTTDDQALLRTVAAGYYWASLSAFNHNRIGNYVLFNVLTLNLTEGRSSVRERALALSVMGITAGLGRMHHAAARYGRDAIELADAIGDELAGAQVRMFDAIRLGALGRFEEVDARTLSSIPVADRYGDLRLAAELRSLAALSSAHRGRLDEALALWKEVLTLAEESSDPTVENWARCGIVEIELRRDVPPSESLCRESLAKAKYASRGLGVEESIRAYGLEAWLDGKIASEAVALATIERALDTLATLPMPNAFWSLDGMSGPFLGLHALRHRGLGRSDEREFEKLASRARAPVAGYARVFPLGETRLAVAEAFAASTRRRTFFVERARARAIEKAQASRLDLELRIATSLAVRGAD